MDGRHLLACSTYPQCQFVNWNNPVPSANVLHVVNGAVLLTRRAHEPAKGAWCLPGGHMNTGEDPEVTARREFFEETGLLSNITKQDFIGARGMEENHLELFYQAKEIAGGALKITSETLDARYFTEDELPEIVFPNHRDVIREWFEANKIDRTGFAKMARVVSMNVQARQQRRARA
jgi:ADP-ribose pyrophosphatase YjhB (NUDIX family)